MTRSIAFALSIAAFVLATGAPGTSASDNGGTERDRVESARSDISRLAVSRDSAADARLLVYLADRAEVVRATSATVLGDRRSAVAVASLCELLARERHAYVRKAVAYALGEIGNPGATAALVERMRHEKDREVRSALAHALGRIGDRAAIPALRERITDKNEFVRREVVEALGRIGDPSTVNDVIGVLRSDPEADVRRSAVVALGALDGAEARAAIANAVHDDDPLVQRAAMELLARPPGE